MSAKLAIVILNWNGRSFLRQFLPSVLNTRYDNYEVVVADNGSSDDSISLLQAEFPAVRIIRLPRNLGFAKGYNEALRQVDAPFYVLLNSDVEVEPDWAARAMARMEEDISIAAVQPRILMQKNPCFFEYAGAAGGWLDYLGYPFARGRVFDDCEADAGQYHEPEDIFWASGAAMFVRSAAYWACGGLDDYFFAHMEEIDLCWRMQLKGYRIVNCPASVVMHVGGGTLPKGNARKVFLNFRNNLVMLFKNLPLRELWWKLPFRMILDIISAWKSLFSGEWVYFSAIGRAHLAFVRWCFSPTTHKRRGGRAMSSLSGYWGRSVVWAYFIKGKRKFSEIVTGKPL